MSRLVIVISGNSGGILLNASVATETEWMDKDFGEKSLVNDRPATRLLSVTTDLDSSSLANR